MAAKVKILFDVFDAYEAPNPQYSADDKQWWVDMNNLNHPSEVKYGTCEPDQFRLDGTYQFAESERSIPLWYSGSMSDERGNIDVSLVVNMDKLTASTEIKLSLTEGWGDFTVTWYHGEQVLRTRTYLGANTIREPVGGYDKLLIRFTKTSPNRFLKLDAIAYEKNLVLTDDSLADVEIVMQGKGNASQIPAGSLAFSVTNENGRFDVLNPEGIYAYLHDNQKMQIEWTDGGVACPLGAGTYYLQKWQSSNKPFARMEATDDIGLLNAMSLPHSPYYRMGEARAVDAINAIMEDTGIAYVIGDIDTWGDWEIVGHTQANTRAQALQDILIATTGVAGRTPDGVLRFGKLEAFQPVATLREEQVLGLPSVTQTRCINGCKVDEYATSFEKASMEHNLGALSDYAGQWCRVVVDYKQGTLAFADSPSVKATVSESFIPSGTISLNSMVSTVRNRTTLCGFTAFEIFVPANIGNTRTVLKIEGEKFSDVGYVYTIDGSPACEIRNNTFIRSQAYFVALGQLGYYNRRISQKMKIVYEMVDGKNPFTILDYITVPTHTGETLNGIVEKLVIHASAGFTADCEVLA